MANDLNSCTFIGRLGKPPEMRATAGGMAIASFSIACGWKSKDKEGTEWVNCTAFGKLAEIVEKYLEKGSQVYVQGKMKTDKWDDKEGNTRYSTKINVDNLQMLGKAGQSSSAPQSQAAPLNDDLPPIDDSEDVPF